jgi:hypothetical protein
LHDVLELRVVCWVARRIESGDDSGVDGVPRAFFVMDIFPAQTGIDSLAAVAFVAIKGNGEQDRRGGGGQECGEMAAVPGQNGTERADWRTFPIVGMMIAARMPMMAITARSPISVKA